MKKIVGLLLFDTLMVGNSADGLEKGIYIKNGKKFIVR